MHFFNKVACYCDTRSFYIPYPERGSKKLVSAPSHGLAKHLALSTKTCLQHLSRPGFII